MVRRARSKNGSLERLWSDAESMDSTLRVTPHQHDALRRKLVRTQPFSRERMFHDMARRRVSVFRNVPVLVRRTARATTREALIDAFTRAFPPREKSRVQVGPSHAVTRLPVREILRRWMGGRAIVGVTDLHIRGTGVERVIDTQALSNFNALIRGSEDLATQEMMTLVIASPGNVTDSHSDDPDGTNHCFLGKKLWLAWDTFEGMSRGLEDVERQVIGDQAKFDMSRFLALPSSRWWAVSAGDTLFLPGSLTHKVVTLEPYLGVGSFHIGLPGSLDTFTRWLYHGPLWSIDDPRHENAGLVEEAIDVALRITRRARTGSQRTKERWGYHHMNQAFTTWTRTAHSDVRRHVMENDPFRQLVELARDARS